MTPKSEVQAADDDGQQQFEEPNADWLDTRLLVCGSRDWTDAKIVQQIVLGYLEDAIVNFGRLVLIEGCARGADRAACQMWDGRPGENGGVRGTHLDLVHEHYPADWDKHGKAAGPIRNRQMLKEGRPQVVIAFSDDIENSKGTKDMVTIAKAAGIPTYVVAHG